MPLDALTRDMSRMIDAGWTEPPGSHALGIGEQHIWLVDLDAVPGRRATEILSTEELARASAYRFDIDRNRYINCRLALRSLLGKYLGIEPACVTIGVGKNGKPHLAAHDQAPLHFNVSHSGRYALIGFSREEIGVDIERHDREFVEPGTLRICLSEREKSAYDSLCPDAQVQRFFDTWTAKESYLKLVGDGLAIDPSFIDLNCSSGAPSTATIGGRNIHFLMPPEMPRFSAAIASYQAARTMRAFRFAPASY